MLDSHLDIAVLQVADCVIDDFLVRSCALLDRIIANIKRILPELRIIGHPAKTCRNRIAVRRMGRQHIARWFRAHGLDVQKLVPPGIRCPIIESCALGTAGGPHPVGSCRNRCPAGLRTNLFLAHIMGPATAGNALAAAKACQGNNRPVAGIIVIPVIDAGAHDNQ